ncbi:t-SNARE [Pelagophyceae sp. CCMP2097]|nr:t-SNARE [Pelagophyceae sp. CCMP2097]
MASRDLTAVFRERRNAKRALAQLQQWTEENCVDGLLAPPPHRDYTDNECGSASCDDDLPAWVVSVRDVESRCMAIECELKRVDALQRRKMLVTFDAAVEEGRERELRDAASTVHENLRDAEAVVSGARGPFAVSPRGETNAAASARGNAQRKLASRLQDLSRRYREAQKEHAVTLRRDGAAGSGGASSSAPQRRPQPLAVSGNAPPDRGGPSWQRIDSDLGFLTTGAERRTLDALESRRPGEQLMSLEDAQRLEEEAALQGERDADIEQIAKSVSDVAAIFKELAVLVIDQGTILDRIDFNMETVSDRVFNATAQLKRAETSSARGQPVKTVAALLVIIAILLILLIRKFA